MNAASLMAKGHFVTLGIVMSLSSFASQVAASAYECLEGQSVCHNTQCCNADQYCGRNSLECEPCFPRHNSMDDNLQLCQEIKNVSDISKKLRDASCNAACLHTFGEKLYQSCPRGRDVKIETENGTGDGQFGSSDVNIPETENGTGDGQFGSSDVNIPVWICLLSVIAVLLIPMAVYFFRRWSCRRSRGKDVVFPDEETPHSNGIETGTWNQQTGSINNQKEIAMASVKMKNERQSNGTTHDRDETERLIADSIQRWPTGENNLQRPLGAEPTQSGETQGIPRESAQIESRQPEPIPLPTILPLAYQRDTTEPTARQEVPQPGVRQTTGAAMSPDRFLNPVIAPADPQPGEPCFA